MLTKFVMHYSPQLIPKKAFVRRHKNSYCLYRSTDLVCKVVTSWNKPDGLIHSELRTAKTRRAQVKEFDFKKQGLFCTVVCSTVDPSTLTDGIGLCNVKEKILQVLNLLRMCFCITVGVAMLHVA